MLGSFPNFEFFGCGSRIYSNTEIANISLDLQRWLSGTYLGDCVLSLCSRHSVWHHLVTQKPKLKHNCKLVGLGAGFEIAN